MRKGGRGGICRAPVAEVPETVGDGAGRTIGEGDRQRLDAVGWAGDEGCSRYEGSDASDRIGAAAGITGGKGDHVGEISGTGGSKTNDQIGRARTGEVEGRAREDREWAPIDRRHAIAQ